MYFALGDGGGANDAGAGQPPVGNGQSGSTLLGKLLRLDVDLPPSYIPVDNPFVGNPAILDAIWAMGLRNPWSFSFDRRTGGMYVADVGQAVMEEINYLPPGLGGLNFGWKCMEGSVCTGLVTCGCNLLRWTAPIEEFGHSFACAVIGGYVYRGCAIQSIQGRYFYGDYCSGRIWSFVYDPVTNTKGPVIEYTSMLAPGPGQSIDQIMAFGEDGLGELLIADRDGDVFKVISAAQVDCNGNGVADICDLSRGISLDVNQNGIPDECDGFAPQSFCSAKLNSLGCLPSTSFSGYSSATRVDGFVIRAANALNSTVGLLLYGNSGRAALPFQGGTLCVNPPVRRALRANSGGTPPPTVDCSGVFAIDMNSFAQGALGGDPSAALRVPGTVFVSQWWGRDTGMPPTMASQLSNGLEFQVCP